MKKNLLAFFAILFIGNFALAQVAWDGYSIASQYAGGTGTQSDPYRISTAPQFMYFLKSVKEGNTYSGKYIKLTNEISLCGNAINLTGQPVMGYSVFSGGEFNGYFDGDNHFINSICNLFCLFHTLNGTVCNLGIENDNTSDGVGSIACTVEQSGIIVSCTRILTGKNSSDYVRRPFSNINKGAIINCQIQGTINTHREYGYSYISAGIAVDNYGTILNIDYSSYSFNDYESSSKSKKLVSNNYYGAVVDFGDLGPGFNSSNNTPVTNSTVDYETWKNNHPSTNYTLPSLSDTKFIYFNDPMGIYTHDAISVPTNQNLSSYLANPSIDDCIFAGWKYKNTTYASTSSIMVTDNMILTPTWTQKITQQPTKEQPTVLVSDSKHALYQWYAQTDGKVEYPNWTSTNTAHGSSSSYTYEIIASEGQQLSIDWNTDSEGGCDELNIVIDGIRVLSKGGHNQTGTLTYVFRTTGTHKVVVSYSKDDSVSDYSDKVWVSNVWLGAAPVLLEGETSNTLSSNIIKKGGIAWCSVKYTNSNEILKSNSIELACENNTVNLIDGNDFSETETKIVDELTFTKTFSASAAGNWNAFYVPMSVDVEEYAGDLDFAEIYAFCATVDTNGDGVVDANDDNFLFVRPVKTGSIKPNVPYLIRPREAKTYVINSADNVLHKATEGKVEFGTTIEKYTVTGLNNSFTVTAGDNNFYVSATGKLNYRTTGSTTVKANRWIMHRESQEYGGGNNNDIAGAKEYRIITIGEDMDEATAIKAINASNANNSGVYTLDGRKVNDVKSLPNGIYIKNGKKIFINN